MEDNIKANESMTMDRAVGSVGASLTKNKRRLIVVATGVAVLLFVVVLTIGYLWWNNSTLNTVDSTTEEIVSGAAKGTVPSISNNPLEGKPNLNPIENTNPVAEVKTNPFE